ncbi:BapA prefix-like domain-containing protein [Pseudomonas putida]|uniref:BapA prefix-like domain-containing protein n=1 Tax=Pseudomonas putida TaxID=303 RepID=A0A4D6X8L0_PSEPU|nr:Ig-like domain-containing protein [Pseudomonas putida]QCI12532.1 BapA prefix-like domain-containing protein [Pseudomonas putida]
MAKAIVVIDKTTHASTQVTQADLTLRAPSIVRLAIDRDQVASMAREGDALVIKTLDGETIVIRGFFGQAGEPDSELVLQDSDGRYWLADINETGPTLGGYSEIDTVEALLVAQGGEHDALAWVAGGLALLAGGVAASSGGGGGGGHPAPSATLQAPTAELSGDTAGGLTVSGTTSPGAQVTVTFPDGSKATVTADANGKYQASASSPQGSGEVHVQAEDGQGNSSSTQADYTDVSPPEVPSINVSANADGGLTVTGSAEAGSVVVVTFPDGSRATAIAGSDGSYSVTTQVPQTSGDVSATATDAAGNTGPAGSLAYVDSTAPEAPVLGEVITHEDGSITVGGSAEPGSTVTVTYPDGSTDTVVAGEDGSWSLTSPEDQPTGDVSATATDAAGNTGEAGTLDYVDSTAPEAPVLDEIVTNEDGSITLGGTAEPGSTVTVTYPDGSTDTVVVDENGGWSLTSPEDQPSGEIDVKASDEAGNTSVSTTEDYTDTTAPEAPSVIVTPNADGGLTVSGSAEAGSSVTVTFPDGSSQTVTAGTDGSYSATTEVPQTSGEVRASATDAAGNTGPASSLDYVDSTAPEAPVLDEIVTNEDGSITIGGTAEPGSTVTVTYPDGSTDSIVVGEDGTWSLTSPEDQPSGEVDAKASDEAGNTSASTSEDYSDTTAPEAPSVIVTVNADGGLTVTGNAEAGSSVTVTFPDGSSQTVTAGSDGGYSATTEVSQTSGEVSATATDAAGNTGAAGTLDYVDSTAPEAPVLDEIITNQDGSITVGGTAEPGSTVTVTYPDGTTDSIVADEDGAWSLTSPEDQPSGEVEVKASDEAGNTSASTTEDYSDTTAPEAPSVIATPNADGGLTVTGSAEAGSSVTVTFPDGSSQTVLAGTDGSYSATTSVPQTSGEVSASATDAAGNTGDAGTLAYVDITAPEAPSVIVLANDDGGLTVTGNAEPGSTVTVTFPDGSTATASADADGSYSVTTSVPQTTGEVSASATDAAGNTGDAGTLDYVDSTAPETPVLDEIITNEDGSITVGGTAEPGSTVTVTYPDGSTDTVVAGEDGTWSLTSPEDQPSGEVEVKASDEAGNTSASTTEDYADTTAPDAPSVIGTPNADGGLTVTGSAEAGSSVTVTFPDGSSQTVTADADGSYSATTEVPQTSGEVSASATDAAGNTGPAGTLDYVDSTAPEAPVLDEIITNEDGSITVGGTAEPGSTVTVTYPDGSSDTAVAGEDGTWSLTSPEDQPNGEIDVKASDEAGNTSASTTEDYSDTTPPEAPTVTVTPNSDGGLTVSGSAEAGSSVTVTFPDGSTDTVMADSDGSYSATTSVPQTSGEVSATATDAAGNTGPAGSLAYADSTAPEAPVLDEIITNEDGSITVGGTTEPGSTVTVTYPDGSTDTVVAGEDGAWSLTSPEDQPSGEVDVKASDEAGNTSASTTEDYNDTTAPEAPSVIITPNADGGLTVTGNAEADSNVTVTFPDGSSQTVTAGSDGSYSATTSVPQTSGEVSASATDAAGNTGPAGSLAYADSTAPEAPVLDEIITNEDGSITLGGTAEPGSTVTVTYPDGSTDTVVAGEDGAWSLTSPEDQPSGEVDVKASDEAGNTSSSATEDYTDTTAPEAPSVIVTPNADGGLTVTGSAEAGSSVTVTFPDGSSQTVTAGSDGGYSATTSIPQTSGEVSATATDAAGNTGEAGTLDYVDSTAPEAPVLDEIITNEDGSITVGGTAEPGSTVTVTYPDGSTDSIVAGEDGTWSLTSQEDQPSGEIDVNVSDEAGNTSASTTEDYSDITAPEAPSVTVTPNADGGLTVTGTAEAGSSVTVTFPDGSSQTVTAGSDGGYSATTEAPQTSGEVSAAATDAAGNTGPAGSLDYVDSTAPEAPVLDEIITNADGSITVGGSAEPGSTVTVTYPDGSTDTVVADEDGTWSMTSPEDQPSGEVEVNASDEAGNTSASTTEDYTDTTAPEAPSVIVTPNADGGLTVTGSAEAGSSVTVTFPDGSSQTVTADAEGNYSATTSVPQTSGEVGASATDAAGNTGDAGTVAYVDSTAPEAPMLDEIITNEDGSITVGGTAEPGSTVNVTYPDGSTDTVVADENGTWSLTSPVDQPTGEVDVKATDEAGNTSASVTEDYSDTTPPETPTVDVTANADGGLTVSGNAEPGTSVTVTFPDGSTGTVTADADGSYSVTTSVPQTSGEVSASATDAAGNTGDAASVDYVDSWAPQVPVLDEIITNTDGSITVAGSAEPGSTVTVTYPDGSTDSVLVGEDGAWSLTSPEDQPTGEVAVEAKDAAGNTSAPVTQDYTDITAPEAPTINIQANDDGGLTVTGNAEPGSMVTVTYPDGSTETVTADADGSYSATTSVPQTSGNVSASATDAAGNTGDGTTADYVDGTAPLAPSVVVNANTDGTLVVSGSAEAGSEVTVTFPDGSKQTVTANAAGGYSVTSASAQGSGEAFAVSSDAAGNSSASSSVHYALATISAVSADAGVDGDFITNDNSLLVTVTLDGQLNAGDTVQVSLDGGNTWHDAVAQGDGTYVFDNSASELGDGTYVFMARVLGSEGNASLAGTQAVEIDTQGPSASLTITFDGISDDNGYLSGDYVTNDSSLGFHGTLSEPLGDGERVQISLDGGATWQDAEVDSGTWSFDNTGVELADGDYDVQVRVVDEAGNLGNSASQKVVIDTEGPSAELSITLDAISSDSGALGDDLITSDNTLVFSGSLSAELGEGEGVEISLDNGLTWYRASVDGTGWVYDHQGQVLADGQYTVQVRVVDDAGNIGQTNSRDVVVDTEAPAFTDAIIDLDDSSDNGSSASDNTTSVITPSITGTITGLNAADSEAAAAGKITVTLFDDINGNGRYDDGDVLYAEGLTLDANGVFTATLPSLVDGSYNIKAVLVDDAGNQSVAGMLDGSEDARLVIDTEGTASVAASTQSADGLGLSMSAIGDVNGDGYVDYVVSAPHSIYGSTAAYGSDIYVLYGNVNGIPSLSSIDNLTPEQGFRITQSGVTGTGGDTGIQGKLVTALGDINGDGYDDFAIASTLNDRTYVIFGGENTNLATLDLTTLENGATSAGFVIKNYNTGGWSSNSVTGGDINGDGYADLIIGSAAGNGGNGMYVVLYGHAGAAGSAEWGNLLLSNYVSDSNPGGLFYATGTTSSTLGSRVENQTNIRTTYTADGASDLGTTVKVIGDVNGDGYADYIVTAPRSNGLTGSTITNSGTAYLIWGSAEGLGDSYNLANLTSDQGVRLVGSQTGEWLGGATVDSGGTAQNAGQWYAMFSNIQNIGDINGDGIEDFAIGSPGWGDSAADTTGPGRVYVIYGKQAGETWTDINLGNLSASQGFIISSSSNGTAISGSVTTADGQLGYAISAGGDVNGDGIDDFLIGMPGYDDGVTNRGAVYLVYGRADGSFDLNTDLDALVASGQAIQYLGLNANDYAGTGLAMGDWNGDGIADYGYGVWQSDSGATNGGAFNIYTGSIALLTHSYTVGDDELWAGSTSLGAATSVDGVDILSGGQGNDIIHGIGTDTTGTTDTSVQHDVAMGGAGDDTIGLVGTTFTRVDGGLGVDTLLFESGGHALNLTEYGTRVKGFEIFDLGSSEAGSGNNTLSLRLADVLSQVDTKDDGLGNLTIKGDSTSTVDLAETVGEGGWAVSGSTTVDGVAFDIWHNATMGSNTNADLLIQHGINVV